MNGNPAVAYYNVTDTSLMFARNSAVDGSGSWNVVVVDYPDSVGLYCSLAVVDGNPAISYYDLTHDDLRYVRATTATSDATSEVIACCVFSRSPRRT